MGPAKSIGSKLFQSVQADDRVLTDCVDRPSLIFRAGAQRGRWVARDPEHLLGSDEAMMGKEKPLPPHFLRKR